MALKIGLTTVVDNNSNGTFNGTSLAPGYDNTNRPSPSDGELIYNKTFGRLQFYNADTNEWVPDLS